MIVEETPVRAVGDGERRPRSPQVYWFLSGPRKSASARLHGFRIHEFISHRGWSSTIMLAPRHVIGELPLKPMEFENRSLFRPGDIVVFQKLSGSSVCESLQILKQLGVRTILVDCDLPVKIKEANLASVTVCSSTALEEAYRRGGATNVVTIRESFEASSNPAHRMSQRTCKLKCVWFGAFDLLKAIQLFALGNLLSRRFPAYKLIKITNDSSADYQWGEVDPWTIIEKCDVVLITGDDSIWSSAKSPNRAIQAMALGLPVIAYPIPAYRQVIRHGRNGMLCQDEEEWTHALLQMSDSKIRCQMAALGYRYATRYYSMRAVGLSWEALLDSLCECTMDATPRRDLLTQRVACALLRAKCLWGIYTSLSSTSRTRRLYLFAVIRELFSFNSRN